MTTGLPVSRLIDVTVNLAATPAQLAPINSLLVVGDSDVIDTQTRMQSFGSLDEVSALFGTSAPEYAAAALWFAQRPQPTQLYIGRWAQAAVAGRLFGGALSATQQALANFTAVSAGGFKIKVDGGSLTAVTSINLSAVTNLNGVATAITTALTGASVGATCVWDGSRFVFKSSTTGASSKVEPLQAPASGTNLGTLLNGTLVLGAREVDGIAAESALTAVTLIDALPTPWYGLAFASTNIIDSDRQAIAAYVEAAFHVYGVSTSAAGSLDPTSTSDIGYLLKAAGYKRTMVQYSAIPYAAVSLLAKALTIDFNANNSTITLMFKGEPGVTAEALTSTQAAALDAKRINYFVTYNNGTAIIENGVMAGDAYIDEIVGADWLKTRTQTDLYNLLYTSSTKIPQTDAGNHQLKTVIERAMDAAENNGLLGPGTWTNGGFGQLKTGDFLPKGYYVYQPPIASQSASDRAARKSVSFQVAATFAGAIHGSAVQLNITR